MASHLSSPIATADVVIIGGGVIGASIAYHLTEAGCRNVIVLERECLQGLGSTGRATGGIRAQFSTPINIQLSLASLEAIRHFKDATGVDPYYRPYGYLFLATSDEQMQVLRTLVALQHRAGLATVRLLGPDEVRALVPQVYTDDVVGASYCPTDGFIEPLSLLKGFTERAVERGAQVWLDTEALGIELAHGVVCGVVTNRGTIATRCVVNAAGAWAKQIARMAGIELPVEPLRRQAAGTQPLPSLPDETPMVIELGTGFHFRKDHLGGGGVLLLWSDPAEPYGDNMYFDVSWLRRMLPLAYRRLPCLRQTQISPRRCWAGLYEVTPDHHPVLGRVPGVEGLYLANGFSGHGVMHAPATGRLLAQLILQGAASLLDITPLSIERFARGELLAETALL
jgi:sarcosine oxidase subunit beta